MPRHTPAEFGAPHACWLSSRHLAAGCGELADLKRRFALLVDANAVLAGALDALIGRNAEGLVLNPAGLAEYRARVAEADGLAAEALEEAGACDASADESRPPGGGC